jgi:hypothetical protein
MSLPSQNLMYMLKTYWETLIVKQEGNVCNG